MIRLVVELTHVGKGLGDNDFTPKGLHHDDAMTSHPKG